MNPVMKLSTKFLLAASLIFTSTNSGWAVAPTFEEFKSLSKLNYICQTEEGERLKYTEAALKRFKNDREGVEAVMEVIELCAWTEENMLSTAMKVAKEQLAIPGLKAFLVGLAVYYGGEILKWNWVQDIGDHLMGKLDDILKKVVIDKSGPGFHPVVKAFGVSFILWAAYRIKWDDDPWVTQWTKNICDLNAWKEASFGKIKFATTQAPVINAFYEIIVPGGLLDTQLAACQDAFAEEVKSGRAQFEAVQIASDQATQHTVQAALPQAAPVERAQGDL